jgi:two-component system cell cycle response regulator DivK
MTEALRVLVVDDNPVNLELAQFVLQADGMWVETAADVEGARRRIEQRPPDVVLLDIQLPGVDGLQLVAALKGDPRTRAIVVIAFTAYAMLGDEERFTAAGCDGYLSKPIDVATFAASVRTLAQRGPSGSA